MNILIVTQKIDINDDVLGFFHRWVEEFAKHCEQVTVICLCKGEYDLPKNVKVFSLGKEDGASRLKYLARFYKYIWQERNNYDSVFVHMNQAYVILGGLFWRVQGKKIMFWYNHKVGTFFTRIAIFFSHVVFYTSEFAFSASSQKSIVMPAGIDIESLQGRKSDRVTGSILSLGRISSVKKIDIIIDALKILERGGVSFSASIYGNPTNADSDYYEGIRKQSLGLEKKGHIRFQEGVSHAKIFEVYARHEIFVNATESGSFDKTILEAMASGTLVLVSNASFSELLPKELMFKENDAIDLAKKITFLLNMNSDKKAELSSELQKIALEKHGLRGLVRKVIARA